MPSGTFCAFTLEIFTSKNPLDQNYWFMLCMLLRSKKLLPEMTRPVSHANVSTNVAGTSERVGN